MNGEDKSPSKARDDKSNLYTLEICFLGLVGLVVVVAFFQALTYKLVSSRTPLVIMAPLFILIGIHAFRLWRRRGAHDVGARLSAALAGKTLQFSKVIGISVWMIGLVGFIMALGHYAGIFLFCLILMRFLAREKWGLTIAVAAATTFFIFGVFEFVFNIELYRGLIVRYFLGFRDF